MTPSEVGERAEAAVVTALVHGGKAVYLPFGASGRCDLIYQDADGLHRMQVKNGTCGAASSGAARTCLASRRPRIPVT